MEYKMEIIDEVQNVRKDGKAIQIRNIWYNFFKPRLDVKKGMVVKLIYSTNKGFNNIKQIEIQREGEEGTKSKDSTNTPSRNPLMPSDPKEALMLTSYIKDIFIAVMNNSKEYHDPEELLKSITEYVTDSYNLVKKKLA